LKNGVPLFVALLARVMVRDQAIKEVGWTMVIYLDSICIAWNE
jgi:hypothetical protein